MKLSAMMAVIIAAAVLSCAITRLTIGLAFRAGILDVPNTRSSHLRPIPRGGGIGIVVVVVIALLALPSFWGSGADACLAIAAAGSFVAVIGLIDDRAGVRWWLRLAVHLASAAYIVHAIDPSHIVGGAWSLIAWPVLTLAGAWALNLFNFMDGIDGIAGTEAFFISASAAAITGSRAGMVMEVVLLGIVAAASLGFLVWNWPPAKIFMGDVGSGFLGLTLFALPLFASARHGISPWAWIILWGAFFADATVTLVSRVIRRERWHEAHCSHAYQRFARRWRSHQPVTLLFLAIDLLWLTPLAFLASAQPRHGAALAAIALLPLALGVWRSKAGSNDGE